MEIFDSLYKFSQKYTAWIVAFLSIFCIFYGLGQYILHPNTYLLGNMYDAMKSVYTYEAYLTQHSGSYWRYESLNYPYGEYLFYLAAYPLLAAVRWFSANIFDLLPYRYVIFNYLYIAGVLLSNFLTYKLLKRWINNALLLIALSVALPWLCPQFERINYHFDLSFSWIILLGMYVVQKFHEYQSQRQLRKQILLTVFFALTFLIMSIFHLYYLPIVGMVILFLSAWMMLYHRKEKMYLYQWLGFAFFVMFVAFVGSFGVVKMVDTYYAFRRPKAEGYDWIDWRLAFSSLFTANEWNFLTFPFEYAKPIHYEAKGYLGAFALYGGCILAVICVRFQAVRTSFKDFFLRDDKTWILLGIVLVSVVCLFTALGENITFLGNEYRFRNYLNPLYLLHKFTDKVEQFRCLGRFSWVTFWGVNFVIAILLEHYTKLLPKKLSMAIFTVLVAMLISDLRDTMRMERHQRPINYLTDENALKEMKELAAKINPADYQAFMPLPFYHVGCEEYNLTVDDYDDATTTETYQFSILTKLPSMASKMARTSVYQAKNLLGMFTEEKIEPELLNRMNDKPVVVICKPARFEPSAKRPDREYPLKVYNANLAFIQKYQLEEIGKTQNWVIYKWDVKKTAKGGL